MRSSRHPHRSSDPSARPLGIVAAVALAALAAVVPAGAAVAAPIGITGAVTAPVAATATEVATTLSAPCGNALQGPGRPACGAPVTMRYGQGVQQQLASYRAGGRTFTVLPTRASDVSTDLVRVDNATATGDRENVWIANAPAGDPFTGVSDDPTGRTMADVLSSPFVTEGSDNLFGNGGGITTNDVERFSVLRAAPLTASDPTRVAVTIVERGGNDAFKLAAVTAVDAAGAPAAWGPVVSVPTSAWGTILTGVTSTVLQQLPGTSGYRPLDYTAAQSIAGVSISLADLGVAAGQDVFGVSLVGNDQTSMTGPWITTTNGTTDGGLDLVSAVFATSVQPTASPDAATGTQGAAQVLDVAALPGDALVPLDPAATRLDAPPGGTVDADGSVVVVPGQGRYELDRATSTVVFTPEPQFTGTATAVSFVVTDVAGATATSTLTATVTPAPEVPPTPVVTVPDVVVEAPAGEPVVIDLPAAVPDLVPGTVAVVDDGVAGDTVTTDDGTWTVQPSAGTVTFTPVADLVDDPAPVAWVGERSDGTALAGRLVVDYADAPAPAPAPAPGAPVSPADPIVPTVPSLPSGTGSAGSLAFTGEDVGTTVALLGAALTTVLGGLALVVSTRRRPSTERPAR